MHECIFVHIPRSGGTSIESVVWPREERTESDLWTGFVDRFHNKYQTGGLQHLHAAQIRAEVGERRFDSYFKFSFVRNPFDKAVSQFAYMSTRPDLRSFLGMDEGDSFNRYLDLIAARVHVQWEPQTRFLYDVDGNLLVDFVGRFERFSTDAMTVFDRIGLRSHTVPHLNASTRKPYAQYYGDEEREKVTHYYAADLATFGYTFE